MTTNDNLQPTPPIPCRVYRSARKWETYLYLRQDLTETAIPESLLALLGRLDLVMELDLHPHRPLARENVLQVLEQLAGRGWYLQMPPPSGTGV